MYINIYIYILEHRREFFKNHINIIFINVTDEYSISFVFLATSKRDFEATQDISDFIIRNSIWFFTGVFIFIICFPYYKLDKSKSDFDFNF